MDDREQIDFRELLGIVRRHVRSIVLITVMFLALGVALVYQRSPVYSSTITVTVNPATTDSSAKDNLMGDMTSEVAKVTSGPILESVLQALNPGSGPSEPQSKVDDLKERVSVVNDPAGTSNLKITCSASSAVDARDCATQIAKTYIENRTKEAFDAVQPNLDDLNSRLTRAQNEGDTTLAATLIQQILIAPKVSEPTAYVSFDADLPAAPSNKGFITTGFLFGFVGFILGIVLALVRERLKDPVVDRDRMAASLGAPSLGIVPKLSRWRGRRDPRPVLMRSPDSPASQAYKAARSTLLHAAASRPLQVIAVVGPGLGDGKTTTTANLAVALAQSGKSVIAVSCDLARPRLHVLFGASNNLGLADVLTGHAALPDAIQPTTETGLSVIASGRVTDIAPEVLLGSDQMEDVLETLRGQFDLVLLDTAPALLVADPLYLAPLTDGVVVVADATRTSRAEVYEVRDTFERVGAWIVGGIVNRAVMKKARYLSRESRAVRDPRTQARTPAPIVEPPKPKTKIKAPPRTSIDVAAAAAAAAERQSRFRRASSQRSAGGQLSDEEAFRARLREETARPREAGDTFCVGVLRVGLRSGGQEEVTHVPDAGSLRRVAEAVQFTMPEGSTMAYLGGGTFGAVLPELRRPEAQGLLVAWEAAAGARLDDVRLDDEVSVRVAAGLCAFQDGGFSGNREAKKIAYEMSDIRVVRQPPKPRAKPKPKSKPKQKATEPTKPPKPTTPPVEREASQATPPQPQAERPEPAPEPEPERLQPQAGPQERSDERLEPPAERPEPTEERREPPAERLQPSSPPSVNLIDLSGNGHGNGSSSEPEVGEEREEEVEEEREDRAAPRNGERSQPGWQGGSGVARPERPDAPAS